MLKFAIAAGVAYQWTQGGAVVSIESLAVASLRTVCATMLAWIVLEACHTLFTAAMTQDPRPGAR
jgi:hypothetical protein